MRLHLPKGRHTKSPATALERTRLTKRYPWSNNHNANLAAAYRALAITVSGGRQWSPRNQTPRSCRSVRRHLLVIGHERAAPIAVGIGKHLLLQRAGIPGFLGRQNEQIVGVVE